MRVLFNKTYNILFMPKSSDASFTPIVLAVSKSNPEGRVE